MTDKPTSPFAGLDKALLRSTRQPSPSEQPQDQPEEPAEATQAQMPEIQQAGKPANQKSRKKDNQKTSKPESRKTSLPEIQQAGNRTQYPKVTYRLHPDAVDAIEDAKRILRRRYNVKVSLEEIAEEAIRAACTELLENQQSSILAQKFAGKPANQKARK
jgi:hypothetical protein